MKPITLVLLALNIVSAAYALKVGYSSFTQVALLWFVVGVAGVTIFAVSLLQGVQRGEIQSRLAGDLAVRAMLGSLGILLAFGWVLKHQ